MNKLDGLECLERLAMPDDVYKKEREKLGLEVGEDYYAIKDELIVFRELLKLVTLPDEDGTSTEEMKYVLIRAYEEEFGEGEKFELFKRVILNMKVE